MKNSQPTLSIVIPVHNAAPFLDRCIGSLLEQTFTDFELILVENGSCDDSQELCRSYAAANPKIRFFSIPHASVAVARNTGIDAAQGQYITFVDADDWAEPHYLAEFFRDPLPAGNVLVVQGLLQDYSEYPGRENRTRPTVCYTNAVFSAGDDPQWAMRNRFLFFGHGCGLLFTTDLLRRHGTQVREFSYQEDHIFFFDYLCCIDTVIWRSGVWLHYMHRKRQTLSTLRYSPVQALRTAKLLADALPVLLAQFGIADRKYAGELYDWLVLGNVDRAIRFTDMHNFGSVLAHTFAYLHSSYCTQSKQPTLTSTFRLLLHLPEWMQLITYSYVGYRRFSLRTRGRIQ